MSIRFLLITLGTAVTVLGHREESLRRKFKTETSNQFLTSFFLPKLNSSIGIQVLKKVSAISNLGHATTVTNLLHRNSWLNCITPLKCFYSKI